LGRPNHGLRFSPLRLRSGFRACLTDQMRKWQMMQRSIIALDIQNCCGAKGKNITVYRISGACRAATQSESLLFWHFH
jgi:hypothetical protein